MNQLYPPFASLFLPRKTFGKGPGDLPPILPLLWGKSRGVALGEQYQYFAPPAPPIDLGATAWYRADLQFAPALWQEQVNDDPNKDLVQATGANQPTHTASNAAFGGQATVDFTPAVAAQFMASVAWAVPLVQPSTTFIVGSTDATNTTAFSADGIGATNRQEILKSGAPAHYKAGATTLLDTGKAVSTPPNIFIALLSGTQSSVFVNARTAAVNGDAGTKGIDGLTVGADRSGANSLTGSIAEVAIFRNVLTPRARAMLLAYASQRYGIVIGS